MIGWNEALSYPSMTFPALSSSSTITYAAHVSSHPPASSGEPQCASALRKSRASLSSKALLEANDAAAAAAAADDDGEEEEEEETCAPTNCAASFSRYSSLMTWSTRRTMFPLHYGFAIETNREEDGRCQNEIYMEFKMPDAETDPHHSHRLQLAGPTLSIRCMMTFDEKRTQEKLATHCSCSGWGVTCWIDQVTKCGGNRNTPLA